MNTSHVYPKIAPLDAPVIAVRTLEWLFSSVNQLMVLQLAIFNRFAAVSALCRFEPLPCVSRLVFHQILAGIENFPTVSASVLSSQLMHQLHVGPQAHLVAKLLAAEVTSRLVLASVVAHVAAQSARIAALLAADVAGEQRRSSSSTSALPTHPTGDLSRQAARVEPVHLGQVLHQLVPVGGDILAVGEDASEGRAGDVVHPVLETLADHLAQLARE